MPPAASDPLAVLSSGARRRLTDAGPPAFRPPMLATLTDRRGFGDDWLLERKLDGVRCIGVVAGGRAQLLTRNELDVTARWPRVAEALAGLGGDAVVDGEVMAMDGDEPLGFQALQQGRSPVALWAFDVLQVGTQDLRAVPLAERIAVLDALLGRRRTKALRRVESWRGDSERRYEEACAAGWEGLIAKRADGPYVAGRSKDWLKLKCLFEQEVVIGGFTEPRGARTGFGALLVGYQEDGVLRYAGKVGTGFDRATLDTLAAELIRRERDASPFGEPVKPRPPGTHWVEPELVAQVAFAEWTAAGRLRQPRFLGLREDKDARDVVRERAS